MNVKIRKKQNKTRKLIMGFAGVYLLISAFPVIVYLGFVIAAMISPPAMCRQSLESLDANDSSICKNKLSRPLMYIYPIIFMGEEVD